MLNVFSVDVEDYFHPTEVSQDIDSWSTFPSRIDYGTNLILDALSERGIKATFFVLGWVAENHPELVRRIADAGHEIGCHSYQHRLVYNLTPDEFRTDTICAINAIEGACGIIPKSYRAPSYSVVEKSLWALEILADLGFTHDSSIYPIVHDRYGIPGFPRHARWIETPSGPICEVPIATVELSPNQIAPVGGGGYLRLFPYRYTAAGIRRINEVEHQPACIYTHPWEFDPQQPRLTRGFLSGVRTYGGLKGMKNKLERLLDDFQFSTLASVHPASDRLLAPFQGRAVSDVSAAVAR
jgi:polysaccharide deacetylase family protein (PEP-CTERM system associated)